MFNINDLYTIKLFLSQWDTDFDQNVGHITYLRGRGCTINNKLYKALTSRFEPLFGTRRISHVATKQGSFKQHINRLYLHDELHQHFAYYPDPLYKAILKSPNDTFYTSKKLFLKLSREDKIKCALEEIYAVATERLIIPWGYSLPEAKHIALKRLCIGLTKGYFNIFLLEHFNELLYSENSYFENKLNLLGVYE